MPNSGCVEFVDQDSINDSLAYFVVVPGLRFDIFWGRTKRFVATTLGSIFAVVNLPPQFLLKCYRTNASDTNPLTPPEFPALRTRSLSRMTRFSYRFGGCFFTSMPGSFFCVFRKPNKGNQAFLCLHRSQIWWRLARSVKSSAFCGVKSVTTNLQPPLTRMISGEEKYLFSHRSTQAEESQKTCQRKT